MGSPRCPVTASRSAVDCPPALGPATSAVINLSGSRGTLMRISPGPRGLIAVACASADQVPTTAPSVPSLPNVPRIRMPSTHPTRSGAPCKTSPTTPWIASRHGADTAATAAPVAFLSRSGSSLPPSLSAGMGRTAPLNTAEACSSGQSRVPATGVPDPDSIFVEEGEEEEVAPMARRNLSVTACVLGRIQMPSTPGMALREKVPVISITPSPSLPQPNSRSASACPGRRGVRREEYAGEAPGQWLLHDKRFLCVGCQKLRSLDRVFLCHIRAA